MKPPRTATHPQPPSGTPLVPGWKHYSDVTSVSRRLKSQVTWLFVQQFVWAFNKENHKAPLAPCEETQIPLKKIETTHMAQCGFHIMGQINGMWFSQVRWIIYDIQKWQYRHVHIVCKQQNLIVANSANSVELCNLWVALCFNIRPLLTEMSVLTYHSSRYYIAVIFFQNHKQYAPLLAREANHGVDKFYNCSCCPIYIHNHI